MLVKRAPLKVVEALYGARGRVSLHHGAISAALPSGVTAAIVERAGYRDRIRTWNAARLATRSVASSALGDGAHARNHTL